MKEQYPNPPEPQSPFPEQSPHRSLRRKIILIVLLLAIAFATTFTYLSATVWHQVSNNQTSHLSNATDNTAKCISSGGVCQVSCANPTAGSIFSSDYINQIATSIVDVFIPKQTSGTVGSVVSSSSNEIGSYPDYCTQDLPDCCAATTVTTSVISTTTTFTPTVNLTTDESKSACNNNCKELGHVSGVCWTADSNNFNCTNPSYSGQVGKELNLDPSRDWCSPFRFNLANGQTSECCCYDS